MDEQDIEKANLVQLILHGREARHLEYKQGEGWDSLRDRITKAVLAMCNIRDGGTIVIGVEQDGDEFHPTGLNAIDLASFEQDKVSAYIAEFADPFADIEVSKVRHDEKNFVVIRVNEFHELPVVCKQDKSRVLRRGALYTRTRRMYESAEVRGQAEMREILDMAAEKTLRAFYERTHRAGIGVMEPLDVDRQRFNAQLQGDYQDNLLNDILSKGHWKVRIRPTRFEQHRIPRLQDCERIIESSVVMLRGWDYPHLHGDEVTPVEDWVESRYDADDLAEYWRFYQSGQFVDHFVYEEDCEYSLDRLRRYTRGQSQPGPYLNILNTLYRVTEIFEFAARLASKKEVFSPEAEISITLSNTRGRRLVVAEFARAPLLRDFVCQVDSVSLPSRPYDVDALVASARELALDVTIDIFYRFNWKNPPRDILAGDQEKLLTREL